MNEVFVGVLDADFVEKIDGVDGAGDGEIVFSDEVHHAGMEVAELPVVAAMIADDVGASFAMIVAGWVDGKEVMGLSRCLHEAMPVVVDATDGEAEVDAKLAGLVAVFGEGVIEIFPGFEVGAGTDSDAEIVAMHDDDFGDVDIGVLVGWFVVVDTVAVDDAEAS